MSSMLYVSLTNIFLLFNPLGWLADKVKTSVASFIYGFFVYLASIIYAFVSWIYQIFLILANGRGIIDDSVISNFVNRVYLVVGVIVLFLVAYSLLKSMINPDEALKGKKTPVSIIKDILISIALIALVPTIFNFAFDFQNSLLLNNTVGKILLGSSGVNTSDTIAKGGNTMAKEVWKAFIIVNDGYCDVGETPATTGCEELVTADGVSYNTLWSNAVNNSSFLELSSISEFIADGKITYIFLLDLAAGIYVLFVLGGYCFDMAIRLVKLSVCELIAPLPILARIIPNEQINKVFSNWLKATISIFTEVFIRIAVLYFAVIIISSIGGSLDNLFGSIYGQESGNFILKTIAMALLVLGIIMFVKQAPEIIKEITGLDSGKYNPIASAMKGFNAFRSIPKTLARSFNNTDWNKDHPIKSAWNKFKNPLADMGSALMKNHAAEYKGLGDIGKNYDKITTDTLAERRRKEAIRKAKQTSHDRNKNAGMPLGIDWKEAFDNYTKGATDTKSIEEKIKLSASVGKDIKSKIIDEAIDKNLKVKQLDNAWKALQNKAVDVADYFERVTADNYRTLLGVGELAARAAGETDAEYQSRVQAYKQKDDEARAKIGQYYDSEKKDSYGFDRATAEARTRKEKQEGDLKKARDLSAFETMYHALKLDVGATDADIGDWAKYFDHGDVDTKAKREFVKNHFSSMLSQFNTDIEYAKAKNKDIESSDALSSLIDVAKYADAKKFKDAIGDRKLAADTLETNYNKELSEARSKEQLKAEIKGDSK